MSATVVREKRQTTLPQEVCDAAGIRINDQIDWTFEDGVIKGRKLVPAQLEEEEIELEDADPKTLLPKDGQVSLDAMLKAIQTDRERR